MTFIVGIDPGLHGAVAFIDVEAAVMRVYDMPIKSTTYTKTKQHIDQVNFGEIFRKREGQILHVYCEEVGSSPQMGVVSAFSFGEGYGIIKGATGALLLPLTTVRPAVWKRDLRVPKDKNEARARACELFPRFAPLFSRVKDDGRAEACMIALWGCAHQGTMPQKPLSPPPDILV